MQHLLLNLSQPSNFTPYLVSLVPSIVMGNYADGPLKALYIANSSIRSHLSTHYSLESFLQFILVFLLLCYQNGIALSLRTVLLKSRTISLPCCDSILYVSCPQRVCLFSVTRYHCEIKSAFLPAASRPFLQ